MGVSVQEDEARTVVKLSGRLDGPAVHKLQEEVLARIRPYARVSIDLSGTTEISSLALRALLSLSRAVACAGGEVSFTSVTPQTVDLLDAIGFLSMSRQCLLLGDELKSAQLAKIITRIDVYPSHEIGGYFVQQGSPMPFGATPAAGGVNFAIHSATATGCMLVLFEKGKPDPIAELRIPDEFRIGTVWAIFVFHVDPERMEYGYRIDGPYDPRSGMRFNPGTTLIDPYSHAITGLDAWGERTRDRPLYRCRLAPDDFDWENERSPGHRMEDLVIYEMHVRGFTRHESSGARWPGTFASIREKIPYLKNLGVNCIELMPIFEFDELDNARRNAETGEPLVNYWGYNTVGFFAPKAGYAVTGTHGMQTDEFKALVKELHRNGIEVMLDVVFNHTAEGGDAGPTISFRGIDNQTYYLLDADGDYLNYSGTGNTLNCNHPVVRDMVRDCLRYWVSKYHIDGFRFDLASILGRGPDGQPLANPPLLEALAADPVLARCKLIAEAWDAAGLYQVGTFPSYGRWAEWNGRYRDTMRRFLKGDSGQVVDVVKRLLGSPDLYADRGPSASVNYMTCHDGFTLMDLVSFNEKHNDANGEDSRDGTDANWSWNCGFEGPTDDLAILERRHRQIKNALAMLFLSQGVPMLLMGDEMGRTQKGNNNAYCHDSPLTWLDWSLLEQNSHIHNFCRRMIALRKEHPCLRHSLHSGNGSAGTQRLDVSWHGVEPWKPDWSYDSLSVAMLLRQSDQEEVDVLYAAFNMYWEPLTFQLPAPPLSKQWRLFADTARPSPQDVAEVGQEPVLVDPSQIRLADRSVVVLTAR